MKESNSRPMSAHRQLIASVLLAEIAGYEDRPVFEQIDLAARCRQLFEFGKAEIPCEALLSVDRESSIVLLFPGDPTDCLRFASWLEHVLEHDARLSNLPIRVGINLGSVSISHNDRNEIQIEGTGIDDALRVAQSGLLREVLISRSFYTVLSRTSMNDRLLRHKAFISDEHDQSFAVYQIARPESSAIKTDPFLPPSAPTVSRSRAQWSAVAAAVLAVAGGLTLMNRPVQEAAQHAHAPRPTAPQAAIAITEPAPSYAAAPASDPKPELVAPVADQPTTFVATKSATDLIRKVATQHVTVQLAIKPWGEIYVDGKKMGVTPPLSKIKLSPGKREIVVRNADFVPFQTTLDVQPESLLQISHRFDK